jgi:hypothetical protein
MNIYIPYSEKIFALLKIKFLHTKEIDGIEFSSKRRFLETAPEFTVRSVDNISFIYRGITEKAFAFSSPHAFYFIEMLDVNEKSFNVINELLVSLFMTPLEIEADKFFILSKLKAKDGEKSMLYILDDEFSLLKSSSNANGIGNNSSYSEFFIHKIMK